MPNLEDFLGKPKPTKTDYSTWEKIYGLYGCKTCEQEAEVAYFNPEKMTFIWVCPSNHETRTEVD